MIFRYKKTLLHLFTSVKKIQKSPYEASELLFEVQTILIDKIRYIESKIRKFKKLAKSSGNQDEESRYWDQVEDYRRMLFLFKLIGDSIAYIYIDRHDFKPIAFNKEPGFISGKVGFKEELKAFSEVTKRGGHCILSDITNVLRHGDLWAFKEYADPLILEIKSSKKVNPRGKRQKKKLEKLSSYLNTDESEDFFEKDTKVVRVGYHTTPEYHTAKLNKTIRAAYKKGQSYSEVEPGLFYVVSTSEFKSNLEKVLKKCQKPVAHYLNTDKLNEKTYPYYPLSLSINDPNYLYDFYNGTLSIVVITDIAVPERILTKQGFEVKSFVDEQYILSVTNQQFRDFGIDEAMKVSFGLFGKIFYEFLSVSWFADFVADRPKHILNELSNN
jgi:hypothetical protein